MINLKRNWVYWLVQLIGWGTYSVSLILSMYFFNDEKLPPKALYLQLVIGLSCLISSHLYRLYIKKQGWFNFKLLKLILSILLGTFIAAFFAQVLIHASMLTFLNWEAYLPIEWEDFPFYLLNVQFMMLAWSVFYFGYHYFEKARNARMQEVRANAAIKEAELIALKAQINPHFLFNALNNIKALILVNQHFSRDAISNLSELLRYSIRFSQNSKVLLIEEIAVVKNYLQLESIHYDQRLIYKFEIEPETENIDIPPMTIQVMVENAIKHGIALIENGGTITIKTEKKDKLKITVSNHGILQNKDVAGTGLRNVKERIKILYGKEPYFSLVQSKDLVIAQLIFPEGS